MRHSSFRLMVTASQPHGHDAISDDVPARNRQPTGCDPTCGPSTAAFVGTGVGAAIAGLLCCFGVAIGPCQCRTGRGDGRCSRVVAYRLPQFVACRPWCRAFAALWHHARTGHGGGSLVPGCVHHDNGVQTPMARASPPCACAATNVFRLRAAAFASHIHHERLIPMRRRRSDNAFASTNAS